MNISYFDLRFLPWTPEPDVYGEAALLYRIGHGFDRSFELVVTIGDGAFFWEAIGVEDDHRSAQGTAQSLGSAKQAAETAAMRMLVELAA